MRFCYKHFFVITTLILPFGCKSEEEVKKPAPYSNSSFLVTKLDELSSEVKDESVKIIAGEPVYLGLKIIFSDGTQELVPVGDVTWGVSSSPENVSSVSIKTNSFRALKSGEYKLVATISRKTDDRIPKEITKDLVIAPAEPEAIELVSGIGQVDVVTNKLEKDFIVRVVDAFSNSVPDVKVSFIAQQGQVTETEVVSGSSGLAKTGYFLGTRAGTQDVIAEIGSFVKKRKTISVRAEPDVPYRLRIEEPQSIAIAGEAFNREVLVLTEDKYGNKVENDIRNIVLSASKDPRCSTDAGSLIGSSEPEISREGLAKFNSISYTIAEKIHLRAISTDGLIKEGCGREITVFPAQENGIMFRTEPIGSLAGKSFEAQPRVDLVDRFKNTVSSKSGTVKLTAFSDESCTIPSLGTLTTSPADFVSGSALFASTAFSRIDPVYLKAEVRVDNNRYVACSKKIRLKPNSPSQIGFSSYPTQIIAGKDFDLELKTKDFLGNDSGAYGKKVSLIAFNDPLCRSRATGDFTLALDGEELPSFLDGSISLKVNYNKSGVVFLKATTEDFSVCSGLIAVNPDEPFSASFINQPGSYNGIIGDFLSINPKVSVIDKFGNLVSSALGSISVAPYTAEGCTSNDGFTGRFLSAPANIIGGVASFRNLSYDKTDILYLKASYSFNGKTLEDCSNPLTYNIDPAGISLSFDAISATGVSGQNFQIQPRVKLSDNQGNPISDSVFGSSRSRISLSAYTDPSCNDISFAPGTLFAPPAIVSESFAQFSNVYYTLSGKIYLKASLGSKSVCSPAITVKASAISKVDISSFSETELIAGELFSEFNVSIKDRYGSVIGDNPGKITFKSYLNNTCTIFSNSNLIGAESTFSNGVFSFPEMTYTKKQTIYIKAQFESDDGESFAQSSCSNAIIIKPNRPTQVELRTPPSNLSVPNQLLSTQPNFQLLDSYGNDSNETTQLFLEFYSEETCSTLAEKDSQDLITEYGNSPELSLAFSVPGLYYLKASAFNYGIEKCFNLDNEKIVVAETLKLDPIRTRLVEGSTLSVGISGGVEPYTCSIDFSKTPAVEGYSSEFLNNCREYAAGSIPEGNTTIKEHVLFTDAFGQTASFEVEVYHPMTFTTSKQVLTSLDYTTVSVSGVTLPSGTSCDFQDMTSCNESSDCLWRESHSTIRSCRGTTLAMNPSCSVLTKDECLSSQNCIFDYPLNDISVEGCSPVISTIECLAVSTIGTAPVDCFNLVNKNYFFISAGKNTNNSVLTESVSISNSDTGQILSIPIDVRPILSLELFQNPTMSIPDKKCSKVIISNKTAQGLVPLNKSIVLPLKTIKASSGEDIGSFYSTDQCSEDSKIRSIELPQGSSSVTLYYKPKSDDLGEYILSFGSNVAAEQFRVNVVLNDPLSVNSDLVNLSTGNADSAGPNHKILVKDGVPPYQFSIVSSKNIVTGSSIGYTEAPSLSSSGSLPGQIQASFNLPKYSESIIKVMDSIGDTKMVKLNVFPQTCSDIKFSFQSASTGYYKIKPSLAAADTVQTVFCDMDSFAGGWTLVMKSLSDNADLVFDSPFWTNDSVLNPDDFNFNGSLNSKYSSYNTVPFDQVMVIIDGKKRIFQFDKKINSMREAMNRTGGVYSIWPNISSQYRRYMDDDENEQVFYFWDAPFVSNAGTHGYYYPHENYVCRNFGINTSFLGGAGSKARLGFQYSQEAYCLHPGTTEGLGLVAQDRATRPQSNSGIYIWEFGETRPKFRKAQVFIKDSTRSKIGSAENPGVSCNRISKENSSGTYKVWRFNGATDDYQLADLSCSVFSPSQDSANYPGTGWTYLGNVSSWNGQWGSKSAIGYRFSNFFSIFRDHQMTHLFKYSYDKVEKYDCGSKRCKRTVVLYKWSGSPNFNISDQAMPYSKVLFVSKDVKIDWASSNKTFGGDWYSSWFDLGKHAIQLSNHKWYSSAGRDHGCGAGFRELSQSHYTIHDNFLKNSIWQGTACKVGSSAVSSNCAKIFSLSMIDDNNGWVSRFGGISDVEILGGTSCSNDNLSTYDFDIYIK